jgi:MGT family glycosyltransferase
MPAERGRWHFGVLSFTGTGHLNPMILLSQQLRDRGHRVTFFEKPKIEDRVRQAGLEFYPIGTNASPFKGMGPKVEKPSPWSELSTLRFNLRRIEHDLAMYFEDTPPALEQTGVDAMLINEIALTGPTIAQMLRLPYFIISTSVPHNFGWNDLSRLSGYGYSASWLSGLQSAVLEVSSLRIHGPIRRMLDKHRRQLGLGPVRDLASSFPALAHITQLPQCLDFPRTNLPGNFHFTGPFKSDATRPYVEFPWARLDGRPILYASLGTTRNVQPAVFHLIAEGCKDLGLQLVISLGGRFAPEDFANLPGDPVVTKFAPQLDLLKLAQIVITHSGPNTVFEALMAGKPMVAVPIALDQSAIAARLARLGIAEVLPVMRLSAERIRAAVTKVLNDPGYRNAAMEMKTKLHAFSGLDRAVTIIEKALETYGTAARAETDPGSALAGAIGGNSNSAPASRAAHQVIKRLDTLA